MKKDKMKGFISGVIVTSMLFALSFTAFAASGNKTIQVAYDNIKVYINEKLTPMEVDGQAVEPFTYQGRTYVPLNAVATALGQQVGWNDATKSVYIGSQPSKDSVAPPASNAYDRANPAPVGTEQTISIKDYSNDYTATIKVRAAYRGQTAWASIRDANRFNDAPTDSREYILLAVEANIDKVNEDKSVSLDKFDFKCFSSTNSEYEVVSTVNPDPKFDGSAFEGGKIEGFISFVVDTDDPSPKIVFGQNRDGSGGIWFSTIK